MERRDRGVREEESKPENRKSGGIELFKGSVNLLFGRKVVPTTGRSSQKDLVLWKV